MTKNSEETKKIVALISEEDEDFLKSAPEVMENFGVSCFFVPKDGMKVVDEVQRLEPDFVVMNLFMPRIDAIGVLSRINKLDVKKPESIIISGYVNQTLEQEILCAGASYLILRPFGIEELAEKIVRISNFGVSGFTRILSEKDKELESKVAEILHRVGIPAHIRGYQYLCRSIMSSAEDPEMINSMTKRLYPTIAKSFCTTSSRVERAIRHAIEVAWDRGDISVLNSYFGFTIQNSKGKPTNSEFIAMISERLRLNLKQN
ncbi:MAG: sporulation transcription factor Spo0A [Oscillospiraceae bacterium]|nr:sporulation transcription factor Spo0A [Oscillospiraceae bacterium]